MMKLGARLIVWSIAAATCWFLGLRLRGLASSDNGLWRNDYDQNARHDCYEHDPHGIGDLIDRARSSVEGLLSRSTKDIARSAAAYRERRGQHPPPGFAEWHNRMLERNAVIVEDFFDQIYIDLEPFWSLDPKDIRDSVAKWDSLLKIRRGKVVEFPKGRFRTREWAKMIGRVAQFLPDLDIPLNGLDEPRVLVPWDMMKASNRTAAEKRDQMMSLSLYEIQQTFHDDRTKWPAKSGNLAMTTSIKAHRESLRSSCPDDSLIRRQASDQDQPTGMKHQQKKGPISDIKASKDICNHPELMDQHGFLIEPATVKYATSLVPVFSSSKLGINSDILLPEPAYYSDQKMFTGKDFWGDWSTYYPWRSKKHGVIWRGGATGGIVRTDYLHKFHRHRFVATLNRSSTSTLETDEHSSTSRKEPESGQASLDALLSGPSSIDVSFTKFLCSQKDCDAETGAFQLTKPMKMRDQFQYKYLPDIDGNTVSGRFHAFLRSNSAVVKSTIFSEWHDARLVPWAHYIPLDMGFGEVFDVLKYFLGHREGAKRICAHDREGRRIAEEGRRWTEKVLRKEDMELYTLRALLEYARIVDDGRDTLGFVGDLIGN